MQSFGLQCQYLNWKNNNFTEIRGRKKLRNVQQKIYDEWLGNSIANADCRNGRDTIRMRKLF